MKEIKNMSLHEKLLHMSNEIKVGGKSGENKFNKFKYYKIEDILAVFIPLCVKYNIKEYFHHIWDAEGQVYRTETHFLNLDKEVEMADGTKTFESYCVRFDIQHGDLAGQVPQQASGSSNTYARRYALMNILGINDSEDEPDRLVNKEGSEKNGSSKSTEMNKIKKSIDNLPEEKRSRVLAAYGVDSPWKMTAANINDYMKKIKEAKK